MYFIKAAAGEAVIRNEKWNLTPTYKLRIFPNYKFINRNKFFAQKEECN
jgi:hypothetical protein